MLLYLKKSSTVIVKFNGGTQRNKNIHNQAELIEDKTE